MNRTVAKLREVPVVFPAVRCCAPGCGDKIKRGPMFEVIFSDGSTGHVEDGCVPLLPSGGEVTVERTLPGEIKPFKGRIEP